MPDILLVRDAIDNMVDYMGGAPQDSEQRILKRIIREAYREFCDVFPWSSLEAECSLLVPSTVVNYSLTYTHSTRYVSSPTSVFTAADVGKRVTFNGFSYPFSAYLSGTTMQLSDFANPGQDVSLVTTKVETDYVLLPADFHKMNQVVSSKQKVWSDCYVEPAKWLLATQGNGGSANPFRWTIMQSAQYPNRWELRSVGDPGSSPVISFTYYRRPHDDLRWSGTEPAASSCGDSNPRISIAAGNKIVTGTATAFTPAMVGAYLRIGATKVNNRDEPTGLDGRSPYVEQHRIVNSASATSLTLETPVANAAAGASFTISSSLDLQAEQYNAFYALCQRLHAIKTQDEDRIAVAERRYRQALRLAQEADFKLGFYRGANVDVGSSNRGDPSNYGFGTYAPPPFG